DFVYTAQRLSANVAPEDPAIISRALVEIEDHIQQCGKCLKDFPELPTIHYNLLNHDGQTRLSTEETDFSQDELQRILEGVSKLNDEQHA
ncbi:12016_t:CDS:1, partial [Acaulospora morrowiae]